MIPIVDEIEDFKKDIGVYISEKTTNNLFIQCSMSEDNIGYLVGDFQFINEQPYVVVTNAFSDIDKIEQLDDEVMVVGWYYCGNESPQSRKDMDIERRFLSKAHHVTLSINPKTRQVKAYKRWENNYKSIPFLITSISKVARDTIKDEIFLEDELYEVKEARKMLEFITLSFISILFGLFGGLLGFFIGDDQGIKRRVLLVIFGVMSTIFWFILGNTII